MKAKKPALADALSKPEVLVANGSPSDVQFVLDGGSLLQRIPWVGANTYGDIFEIYTNYVKPRNGTAIIVFDGYLDGPSIKDSTRIRRSKCLMDTTVNFDSNTPFK